MCGGPPAEDTDQPKVDGHLKASITESFQLPSLSLPGWHMGARSAQGLQLNQMISKEQGDCGAKFPFTEKERPPHCTPTGLTIPREWSTAPAASQGTQAWNTVSHCCPLGKTIANPECLESYGPSL